MIVCFGGQPGVNIYKVVRVGSRSIHWWEGSATLVF